MIEVSPLFLRIIVLFVPSIIMGTYSRDFSFMLIGFSIGVVIGMQTNILADWWITLAVIGVVASLFFNRGVLRD